MLIRRVTAPRPIEAVLSRPVRRSKTETAATTTVLLVLMAKIWPHTGHQVYECSKCVIDIILMRGARLCLAYEYLFIIGHARSDLKSPTTPVSLSVRIHEACIRVLTANPQKTVLFLLRMCYGTHNMLGIYYHLDDCIELRA